MRRGRFFHILVGADGDYFRGGTKPFITIFLGFWQYFIGPRCRKGLTLFYTAALFLRFLHHDSYLGPLASVLLDPKCVAPGYMFSEAMFQASKLNSKNL